MHDQSPVQSQANRANRGEADANPANRGGTNPGRDVGKGYHKRTPPKHLGANTATDAGRRHFVLASWFVLALLRPYLTWSDDKQLRTGHGAVRFSSCH